VNKNAIKVWPNAFTWTWAEQSSRLLIGWSAGLFFFTQLLGPYKSYKSCALETYNEGCVRFMLFIFCVDFPCLSLLREMLLFLQNEDSPTSHTEQREVANVSSVSPSSVVYLSDEANHESSLRETVQPHTVTIPETCRLPEDLEDDLDDVSGDVPVDISNVSKEDLLQIHTTTAEQRNSYRRKCVQVSRLN